MRMIHRACRVFSEVSSNPLRIHAQGNRSTIIMRGAFPHFHSDYYYYYLYTYIKTGYISPSQ
jgi:hypothetical protein